VKAYEVEVETTNALGSCVMAADGKYCDCEKGTLVVATDDPKKSMIFSAIKFEVSEGLVSVTYFEGERCDT